MNEKNIRLVTAESVRAGHPDKFCDQVADAILDAHLRQDPNAHVAVEVFATAGKIVVGGEVTSRQRWSAAGLSQIPSTASAMPWAISAKTPMACWNWRSVSTNSLRTSLLL